MSTDELRGACKAWNLVYELSVMHYKDFEECFDGRSANKVFSMNYLDVLKQYEAWKANKEAFHVGDEVKQKECNRLYIVTCADRGDGSVIVMDSCGQGLITDKRYVQKTGRTYPKIKDVIDELQYACHASCASSSASDAEGSTERG